MNILLLKTKKLLVAYRKKLSCNHNSIGFVPTMGALHQGHLALIEKALQENKHLIISIFVNPSQFAPNEDFENYPRNLNHDITKIKSIFDKLPTYKKGTYQEKTIAIFSPSVTEMKLPPHATQLTNPELGKLYCGVSRPHFFNGVLSIVSRLFSLVQPHIAYFGKKDYQQFFLIKQMAKDLEFHIDGSPLLVKSIGTVRDENGLALSSRNNYLSATDKKNASLLYQSLLYIKELLHSQDSKMKWKSPQLREKFQKRLRIELNFNFEYLYVVCRKTLLEIYVPEPGKVIFLTAAYYKNVRLIDSLEA